MPKPNAPMAALLLLACSAGMSWAQAGLPTPGAPRETPGAAAGLVKRSQGSVTLAHAGQELPARPGMVVAVGDTLRTGPDGAVGITPADDTLLTAGPDSELVISAFGFEATGHDGKLLASLWRGTLSVVTGLIGKKTPENVKVQTRTVVLGTRGTEFIVDASEEAR